MLERTHTLITGDSLTRNAGTLRGPIERATQDMEGARASIRMVAELDVDGVVCYHGGSAADGVNGRLKRVGAETRGWQRVIFVDPDVGQRGILFSSAVSMQSNYPRPSTNFEGAESCPRCRQVAGKRVRYTWWGGAIGPAMLNLTKCHSCGYQFNCKTGKSTKKAILVYKVVAYALCIVAGPPTTLCASEPGCGP